MLGPLAPMDMAIGSELGFPTAATCTTLAPTGPHESVTAVVATVVLMPQVGFDLQGTPQSESKIKPQVNLAPQYIGISVK